MHDPKRPPHNAPLEVELPELPAAASRPAFDDKALQARARDRRDEELAAAMAENLKAQPDFRAFAWKSFVALGIACLVYFLSWARSDPVSFREGAGLLWRGLEDITLMMIVWSAGLALFQKFAPETQRRMGRFAGISCLALLLLVMLNAIGLFERPGHSVWTSGRFVLTLFVQGCAWLGVLRVRRRFASQIESGEGMSIFSRPFLYLCEAFLIVLSLGILLQTVFHIDVPAIYGAILGSPKFAAVCGMPIVGYALIRKLTEL